MSSSGKESHTFQQVIDESNIHTNTVFLNIHPKSVENVEEGTPAKVTEPTLSHGDRYQIVQLQPFFMVNPYVEGINGHVN
ncbi:hypothetical protein RUM43_002558 [Polyplax serrata]|uniref:Uncharacterized protein n=1 Tax=Polyplax serrata TaxID=468196 RepID=A0AAN8PE23_POLSC